MKRLNHSDGYETSSAPDQGNVNATQIRPYATRALYLAYLTAQGITLANGHCYYNTTGGYAEIYSGSAWHIFSTFYIPETTFTIANNQASAASVTGLDLDESIYKSYIIFAEVRRKTDSSEVVSVGQIMAFYYDSTSSWLENIIDQLSGDDDGVTFSITAAGQIQYVSDNMAGSNYSGQMTFKAIGFGA